MSDELELVEVRVTMNPELWQEPKRRRRAYRLAFTVGSPASGKGATYSITFNQGQPIERVIGSLVAAATALTDLRVEGIESKGPRPLAELEEEAAYR